LLELSIKGTSSVCVLRSPGRNFSLVNFTFHSFHLQLIGTICGYYWAELFQTLVRITNSCDKAGTIANELPIVEQIPVSG
jgi:hypothetical protein